MEKQLLSLTSTICRSEDQLSTEIDNETVLMSIEQGCYYGLDTIGTDIWRRLDKPVTVSDLCAALSEEYDADIETIRNDVLMLLNQLAVKGLVDVKS